MRISSYKYAYLRSGCVRVGAYNLILIFASFIMLPGRGPGPGPVLCIDDSWKARNIESGAPF